MQKTTIARSIAALAGVGLIGGASASGFQLMEQNASGLGSAYAGSAAVADNASTVFFNPAGMTQLQEREISTGLNFVTPSFKFSDQGTSVTPATKGSTGGDAGGLAIIPNGYLSWGVTKDIYLGLGLNSPFGLATKYDDDWMGRFQSTEFDIKTYNLNPSLAFRVNEKVSLGFGLNWQRMEATYKRFAATANPALNSAAWPALQATKITLDADGDAWGWNLGALFQVSDAMKIGLSYRSEIKHKLTGTLNSTNQAFSPDVGAKADITLPDTLTLSVAQKLDDKWEMLGDLSRTGWSSIQNVDIWRTSGSASGQATPAQTLDTKFRDTWRVALGANYQLNEQWKLKYGIAYDQTPVRGADTRLVSLPDNDRIWFTLGAQWKPAASATVDLGAAYIMIRDAKIDNDQNAKARGRVTGEYSGNIWILGAQYSMSF